MTRPQPRYHPGDKIGGRFLVHQALMGGMGEVYLSLDLREMFPVALKTFQQRYIKNPQLLRKFFENEVATWVALEKHPNIVKCYWMQPVDDQLFMALEWVATERRGSDLRSWLRYGPLNPQLALDFTIDICRGLIHAQSKQPGIVHRDLKPDNILIAQGQLAKITDFGLAKVAIQSEFDLENVQSSQDGRQHLSNMGGTPPYMAPEQWIGDDLDQRTDIYAIGCILHELLTGMWPYVATNLDDLHRQHLTAKIPTFRNDSTLPNTLNTLLAQCLAKRREERYPTIRELLNSLVKIYLAQFAEPPKSVPASGEFTAIDYTNRGFTYSHLKQYDKALADLERAIEMDPNYAEAYSSRGRIYADLQKYEVALADLDRSIELDSSSSGMYYNRGLVHYQAGDYQSALIDYGQAIKLDPVDADIYINQGMVYSALHKDELALENYNKAIELNPSDPMAYYNRGNLYHRLGQDEAAMRDLNRSIELDPNYVRAYVNRGVVYKELGAYEAALADFNRAIDLAPNNVDGYLNRGAAYGDLKEYEAALADWNRAIELNPTDSLVYFNRGTMLQQLHQSTAAVADFSRAIEIDPNNPKFYINRGTTYNDLQQYEAALVDCNKAIELNPNIAAAYTNRANAYMNLYQIEPALADCGRSIQLDPKNATAYNNRGVIYAQLNRFQEALIDFSTAISVDPDLIESYINMGATLATIDQLQEALIYFEKAAQLGEPKGKYLANQVRKMLGESSVLSVDSTQAAFEGFQRAVSVQSMQQTVTQFPFMVQVNFITVIEQIITQQVPPEHRRHFEQRLIWLKQIAQEQNQ